MYCSLKYNAIQFNYSISYRYLVFLNNPSFYFYPSHISYLPILKLTFFLVKLHFFIHSSFLSVFFSNFFSFFNSFAFIFTLPLAYQNFKPIIKPWLLLCLPNVCVCVCVPYHTIPAVQTANKIFKIFFFCFCPTLKMSRKGRKNWNNNKNYLFCTKREKK